MIRQLRRLSFFGPNQSDSERRVPEKDHDGSPSPWAAPESQQRHDYPHHERHEKKYRGQDKVPLAASGASTLIFGAGVGF